MKKTVIEYVCWGNIVRSSTYEAVTQYVAERDGLQVVAVSSGLHVERWNFKQFAPNEIEFFLNETLKLEQVLSHVPAYKPVFSDIKEALRLPLDAPDEKLLSLTARLRKIFEGYNARLRQEALLLRGVEFFGVPKQTVRRGDVDVVIPMAERDVPAVEAIYKQTPIVAVSTFGNEPAGFGYTLEAHLANVDLAFEHVPRIIDYVHTV